MSHDNLDKIHERGKQGISRIMNKGEKHPSKIRYAHMRPLKQIPPLKTTY